MFYSDQNIWSALDLGSAGAAAQDFDFRCSMLRTDPGWARKRFTSLL
jgi:hypothetical protein